MSLAIPLRNTGLLDSLAKQVSDPSSPQFRHFLTAQQIANEFLPTAAFNSLLQYVEGSGLDVLMTGLDSVIVAQGTAAQIHNAFGASVDVYSNGTSSYYVTAGPTMFQGAYLYASNATFIYSLPAVSLRLRLLRESHSPKEGFPPRTFRPYTTRLRSTPAASTAGVRPLGYSTSTGPPPSPATSSTSTSSSASPTLRSRSRPSAPTRRTLAPAWAGARRSP